MWTSIENRKEVQEIVENVIRENGFEIGISLLDIDEQKDHLEKEINSELFYSQDVYETVQLKKNDFFKYNVSYRDRYNYSNRRVEQEIYLPHCKMKTKGEFYPIDMVGNEIKWIKCDFQRQGVCKIKINEQGRRDNYYLNKDSYFEENSSFTPEILFHKGDKKQNINQRLIDALKDEVLKLSKNINELLKEVNKKREKFCNEISTPFLAKKRLNIVVEGVDKQIEELELRMKDCDRLLNLVR